MQSGGEPIDVSPIVESSELDETLHQAGVNDEEIMLCRALYEQYTSDFDDARRTLYAQVRENMAHNRAQAALIDPSQRTQPPFPNAYDSWRKRRHDLDTRLLNDVGALLDDEAAKRWISAARRFRRACLLNEAARLGTGRTVDLAAVLVETVQEPFPLRVRELVAEYETSMDHALNALLHQYPQRVAQVTSNLSDKVDPGVQAEIVAAFRIGIEELRYAVEQTNTQYAVLISQQLDEVKGATFLDRAYASMYPEIFVLTPVEYIEQALADRHVSQASRNVIGRVMEEYARRQQQLRMELVGRWERWDTLATRLSLFEAKQRMQQMSGPGLPSFRDAFPHGNLLLRGRELVETTCIQLRSALTAAEYDGLPLDIRMMLEWYE
ncbi:MAG: hypothetical protein ACR2GY_14570 [Phycisphaerales bacterium]